MRQILFTSDGFENLKKKQQELLQKRPTAVDNLQKARELGDLSENGAYKAARFELSNIDGRLRRLDRLIRFAKVVEANSTDVISIDSRVTISDGENTTTYHIVGGYEANPLQGKISYISPIGKALLGKKVGDEVEVAIPKGKVKYKIVAIAN